MSKALTSRERYILQALDDGGELTFARPGGWWLDLERVGGKTAFALIRSCAISTVDNYDDDYQIWEINETGRKCLAENRLLTLSDILNLQQ